jgi:hypothetical protein
MYPEFPASYSWRFTKPPEWNSAAEELMILALFELKSGKSKPSATNLT